MANAKWFLHLNHSYVASFNNMPAICFVLGRIRENMRLKDTKSKISTRMTRRACELFGSSSETMDDWQIGSYGIGGQYTIHHDYLPDDYMQRHGWYGSNNRYIITLNLFPREQIAVLFQNVYISFNLEF